MAARVKASLPRKMNYQVMLTDDAVQLPDGVISGVEILDGPSVASTQFPDADTLWWNGASMQLGSESIYAPADGYVFAIDTALAKVDVPRPPNTDWDKTGG
ncbi:MAG: hypothetical protein ABIK85_08530 [Candidatus Eisenbacteria bacterium]